ncbi:MAG: DUF1731 domain-containing protein [Rhizobiaceae bacterium]|nr:DUF1731 domain-containing protein [Rhizobiaceae bacterium]MCV0406609.1 DUF1731 domain-containing protein [Rhizobiaceae bacterium]
MTPFVFGAGYSGRFYARTVRERTDTIFGTTRAFDKAAMLEAAGMKPLVLDETGTGPFVGALRETTHLVVSAAPGEGGDPLLEAFGRVVVGSMPKLEWVGYLSTVGVYGNHDGAWVTEEAELRPSLQRTGRRVEAETQWLNFGVATGVPVAVLRLSGIYGPGRNALANLAAGTARRIVKQGQIFNRIEVRDIAGALVHLGERRIGGIFNVSDDEPSPPQDVVAYAAMLMGMEPPPEIPFEEAELSPMARSFYGETKKVSNERLKSTGYRFRFPDFRTALDQLWASGDWKAER